MSGLVAHALSYAARGWSILPARDKKPAVRSWMRYQTERAPKATLQRWFRGDDVAGLAVVCGPVSGGLVVRDYDNHDAYARWARQRPDLAERLPTVQTPHGRHVYFQDACDAIVSIDRNGVHEGELRGAGIVLLPPSRLSTGHRYEWTIPLPDGPLMALDAVEAGLLPDSCASSAYDAVQQREQRERREQSKQKTTEKTEDMCGGLRPKDLSQERIVEIVQSTQPQGPGQRNRAVFDLARTLKGEAALFDADPRDLRPIVEAWHKRALPVITTEPFEETWIDFLQAWPKVKYPKGAGPMDVIFERVAASNPPEVALRYEQRQLRQLVSLCRELQRHSGSDPFYLGCRTAGRLLGVDHTTAWRWLFLLKAEGVLRESEKGGQGEHRHRATRYFYEGDDDPAPDAITNLEPVYT